MPRHCSRTRCPDSGNQLSIKWFALAGEFLAALKIATVSVPQGKSIKQSEDFLAAKHNQLNRLESVEDLVLDETKLSEGDRQAIGHHILNIRAATARALWLKEI